MKISQAGVALIKKFEGLRLRSYLDSAGIWTIGYGHTSAAGLPKVTADMVITAEEAETILKRDLVAYENAVAKCLKRPVNPNQFAAFVSLCYNIGPGAFTRSTVVKRFNEGDEEAAADAFLMWNKAGGRILRGLENRRFIERQVFLNKFTNQEPSVEKPETVEIKKPKKTLYDLIIDIFFAIFGGRK